MIRHKKYVVPAGHHLPVNLMRCRFRLTHLQVQKHYQLIILLTISCGSQPKADSILQNVLPTLAFTRL